VLRATKRPTYETEVAAQIDRAKSKHPDASIDALLRSGDTWRVE
jgi:hypothetical protein